jgi:glycerol uptake facilitator-like aquaporin
MKIWLAEFIGTFALLFAGVGAIASGAEGLAIAFAFGLTVAVMIASVGGISFAHFNPAVTVGFFVLGRINFLQLLLYWSAELLGATFAIFLLQFFYGAERLASVTYGVTQLAPDVSPLIGVGIEAHSAASSAWVVHWVCRNALRGSWWCSHGCFDESCAEFCTRLGCEFLDTSLGVLARSYPRCDTRRTCGAVSMGRET